MKCHHKYIPTSVPSQYSRPRWFYNCAILRDKLSITQTISENEQILSHFRHQYNTGTQTCPRIQEKTNMEKLMYEHGYREN